MVCRLIANFDLPPLRIIGEKKDLHFEMEWMAYNSKEELDKVGGGLYQNQIDHLEGSLFGNVSNVTDGYFTR